MRYALWKMHLRLDPWAAEYNTAYYADNAAPPPAEKVEPGVEVPAEAWRAIRPVSAEAQWDRLLFIDGSRRIEARVLLEDTRVQLAFGALGSYGVGVVDCCSHYSRRARFLDSFQIRRICALSGGQEVAPFIIEALESRLGELHYEIKPTQERDADAVVRQLQRIMLDAEGRMASSLLDAYGDALIICDGPRPLISGEPRIVGYVKTIHDLRLAQEQLETVRGLEAGERSPLYLVKNDDPERQFFEWFLRLRDPRPWLYSLAGMVRLQAYAGARPEDSLEATRRLADWLTLALPTFASRQHQDPRAPQQLLPVRALEAELSRRMGHAQIVRRRVTRYLSTHGVGT